MRLAARGEQSRRFMYPSIRLFALFFAYRFA
jgi:hypothetical protein